MSSLNKTQRGGGRRIPRPSTTIKTEVPFSGKSLTLGQKLKGTTSVANAKELKNTSVNKNFNEREVSKGWAQAMWDDITSSIMEWLSANLSSLFGTTEAKEPAHETPVDQPKVAERKEQVEPKKHGISGPPKSSSSKTEPKPSGVSGPLAPQPDQRVKKAAVEATKILMAMSLGDVEGMVAAYDEINDSLAGVEESEKKGVFKEMMKAALKSVRDDPNARDDLLKPYTIFQMKN